MKSSVAEWPTHSARGPFVCTSAPLASVCLQGETSVCVQVGRAERWLRVGVCVRKMCVECVCVWCVSSSQRVCFCIEIQQTLTKNGEIALRAEEPKRNSDPKNWSLKGR